MLPIVITPEYIKAIVIGEGPATSNRLKMLDGAGVKNVKYFKNPPHESEFENINIAYIADFDDETSAKLFEICQRKNILTNVEDKKQFCNFHVPSLVRRGDLLVTASTNGKSPRLARLIRKMLEAMFPEKWARQLEELHLQREKLKQQGFKFDSMAVEIDKFLEEKKYLEDFCTKCKDAAKK